MKTTITAFNDICKTLSNIAGIKQPHVLVAKENHATNKLQETEGLVLVAVMPSIEFDGQPDEETESQSTILFVLEKTLSGSDNIDELAQYQRCEDAIRKIKDHISGKQSEGCSSFVDFEIKETVISPEYREFSDWNGYSMTLVF